jgi:hypothetical protein
VPNKWVPEHKRFYDSALDEDERRSLRSARRVEGLAEEIAVLRVKLRTAVAENPEDIRLLTHGIDLLVKAVATQYRLSPKARKDLADHITNVLNSLGDQLLPASR